MLLKEIKNIFHKDLDALYGKEEVSSFFFLCVENYYNISRLQLALNVNLKITKEKQSSIFNALNELKKQKPIQYILGETEFYGLPFKVNKNTLIPRPETEELVALIVSNYLQDMATAPVSILDIGTGSGCIAIALAKNIKKAKVYGLDVSSEALKMAKENASINEVNVTFFEANILKWRSADVAFLEHKYNIIVSNPPYVRHLEKEEIKNNVLAHEPHLALFVDNDNPLVFYNEIASFALNNLKPNGLLYFEINEYLGAETKALVETKGFKDVTLIHDMFGKDRMLLARK